MAVLYNVNNRRVTEGPVLTNFALNIPAGTPAITYDIAVDDYTADIPTPADLKIWVEYMDAGGAWREVSRFEATQSVRSIGRVPVRGSAMRVNAVAGMTMRIDLTVETST